MRKVLALHKSEMQPPKQRSFLGDDLAEGIGKVCLIYIQKVIQKRSDLSRKRLFRFECHDLTSSK
jgi:hypothetical protein